jgi:hypothetical protein
MDLYFGGCEQGAWRELLFENGVRHMSLSFLGLRRRVKRLDRWMLADKFPSEAVIYLDSGTHTLNKPGAQVTAAEAEELEHEYRRFVEANLGRLEFAAEFDANVLGHDAIFANREEFWNQLPEGKWMPVWHSSYGTSNLIALSDSYPRVGVLQNDAGGDLTFALNRMAAQTKLHGVSMTEQDVMKAVRWSSVGSARWLATAQFGETFIWTRQGELKDYPKKYQSAGRTRHRTWLDEQGFDTDLIENHGDEPAGRRELLRLSIWSWSRFIESLAVTTPADVPDRRDAEQPGPSVGIPQYDPGNGMATTGGALVPVDRERTLLPVIGFQVEQVTETGDDGQPTTRDELRITKPSAGVLQCSTCFIKDKCAAAEPGSSCKYEIPVELRTPAQLQALRRALIEMQTHRVLRMGFFEEYEGGYADPNTSIEMARLWKMIGDEADGNSTFRLTVEASGNPAQAGMISRIFGQEAGDRLALPQAVPAQTVVDDSGILDGEVTDG